MGVNCRTHICFPRPLGNTLKTHICVLRPLKVTISPDVAKLLAVVTLRKTTQALYVSTRMEMWQRLCSWKISWDFAVRGRVIRLRRRCLVLLSSEGDPRVVVICLTFNS
jgi:hypothetical protein